MNLHVSRLWTELRLLILTALLVPAALACLVYYLGLRPLAAIAAARQISDVALVTGLGMAALSSEQQAQFAGELQRQRGYTLVDDALIAPRLEAPSSAWLRMLAQRLAQREGTALKLRVSADDGRVWVNVDSDERRYWLAVPAERLDAHVAIWLTVGAGGAGVLCVLALLLEMRRRSARIRRYSTALRHIGSGDVAVQLPEQGSPEEVDFAAAFNTMVASLRRLDSESRLLLGGISHDLRTPLTSMHLGLELAKDEMEPGLAASLYQDAADLESILTQFLDYARDDTLEAVEKGDLNELILDIARHMSDRGHDIDLDLAPVPAFEFRKLAMRRLISNLLNNAINYAGVGVGVRTRAGGGGRVEISIVDSGPGFDEAQLQQLLRPYVRGTQTDNRHPGSGLGLTIASRIARIHGGTLRLSNRPQGGLEAKIEMPLRDEKD